MNLKLNLVINEFKARFESKPLIIRSPGRINLVGEHTDYNDGFVMPAAIDKAIYFAIQKNNFEKTGFMGSMLRNQMSF